MTDVVCIIVVALGECLISWKGGDEQQIVYVSFKGNDLSIKSYPFGHPVQTEGKMIFICFIYVGLTEYQASYPLFPLYFPK